MRKNQTKADGSGVPLPIKHQEAPITRSGCLAGSSRLDTRLTFRDYVQAGHHLDKAGNFRGYEGIGAALGVGHSTAHRWMVQDFPTIVKAARITAGPRGGAKRAGAAPDTAQHAAHGACHQHVAIPWTGITARSLLGRYATREAFRAFIREGKHKEGAGFLSYREIGVALQHDPGTVWRWMAQDFPGVARLIRGERREVNAVLRAVLEDDEAGAASEAAGALVGAAGVP